MSGHALFIWICFLAPILAWAQGEIPYGQFLKDVEAQKVSKVIIHHLGQTFRIEGEYKDGQKLTATSLKADESLADVLSKHGVEFSFKILTEEQEKARTDFSRYEEEKRSIILASIASALIPGLGQWHNREHKKAWLFFGYVVAEAAVNGATANEDGIHPAAWIPGVIVRIWSSADAYRSAKRINRDLREQYKISLYLDPFSKRFLLVYRF